MHPHHHTSHPMPPRCACCAAREFDVIILEDDPYFFLQYPGGTEEVPGVAGLAAGGSYLSLDVDGRVVRWVGLERLGGVRRLRGKCGSGWPLLAATCHWT